MSNQQPRVFISYVHEDTALVDSLCGELKKHRIKYWLDRNDIAPGTLWQTAIRRAIQKGIFFIACFSENSVKKRKSYMNEELTLAIDELRQYSTDVPWFIPVKLSDCKVPDRDIGNGRSLLSLQYVNFHKDWDAGIKRIVSIIKSQLVN